MTPEVEGWSHFEKKIDHCVVNIPNGVFCPRKFLKHLCAENGTNRTLALKINLVDIQRNIGALFGTWTHGLINGCLKLSHVSSS